jgi:hypothetical protein
VLENFTVEIYADALQATTGSITTSLEVLGTLTSDTLDSVGTTLTLGGTNATNIIADALLTLTPNLTMGTFLSVPTSLQLGYTVNVLTNNSTSTGTANSATNVTSFLLPIRTYIFHFEWHANIGATYTMSLHTATNAISLPYIASATTSGS